MSDITNINNTEKPEALHNVDELGRTIDVPALNLATKIMRVKRAFELAEQVLQDHDVLKDEDAAFAYALKAAFNLYDTTVPDNPFKSGATMLQSVFAEEPPEDNALIPYRIKARRVYDANHHRSNKYEKLVRVYTKEIAAAKAHFHSDDFILPITFLEEFFELPTWMCAIPASYLGLVIGMQENEGKASEKQVGKALVDPAVSAKLTDVPNPDRTARETVFILQEMAERLGPDDWQIPERCVIRRGMDADNPPIHITSEKYPGLEPYIHAQWDVLSENDSFELVELPASVIVQSIALSEDGFAPDYHGILTCTVNGERKTCEVYVNALFAPSVVYLPSTGYAQVEFLAIPPEDSFLSFEQEPSLIDISFLQYPNDNSVISLADTLPERILKYCSPLTYGLSTNATEWDTTSLLLTAKYQQAEQFVLVYLPEERAGGIPPVPVSTSPQQQKNAAGIAAPTAAATAAATDAGSADSETSGGGKPTDAIEALKNTLQEQAGLPVPRAPKSPGSTSRSPASPKTPDSKQGTSVIPDGIKGKAVDAAVDAAATAVGGPAAKEAVRHARKAAEKIAEANPQLVTAVKTNLKNQPGLSGDKTKEKDLLVEGGKGLARLGALTVLVNPFTIGLTLFMLPLLTLIFVIVFALSAGGSSASTTASVINEASAYTPTTQIEYVPIPKRDEDEQYNPVIGNYQDTFMVGDSIMVYTRAQLEETLPGVTVNAVGGRALRQGGLQEGWQMGYGVIDHVRQCNKNGYTRFVIGTGNNDVEGMDEASAEEIIAMLKGKHIWFVTQYVSNNTVSTANTNATIDAMCKKYKNVRKIDWNATITSNLGWLRGDTCHPTAIEAREEYARIVKNALDSK